MKKTITEIWNTLLTTGQYTPDWKPGQEQQNMISAISVCKELVKELGGKEVTSTVNNLALTRYIVKGKTLMVYHTYDFANFKSSVEPGFAETSHYIIRCK